MDIKLGSCILSIQPNPRGPSFSSGRAHRGPAAWKVETIPGVMQNPNMARYYGRLFNSKFYQKSSFQYMFGGLLRAIFGVFSPYRYWDRETEALLKEDMASDYLTTKRTRTYGIYTFLVNRPVSAYGVLWPHTQRPVDFDASWLRMGSNKKTRVSLPKAGHIYVRLNSIDWPVPVVDIEFYSRRAKTNQVITVSKDTFNRLARTGKFQRRGDIDGGRIWAFLNRGRGKRA
jgi:hypothetical protein